MKKKNDTWTIEDIRKNIKTIEFPEYQREPIVWSLVKKQRLIDASSIDGGQASREMTRSSNLNGARFGGYWGGKR